MRRIVSARHDGDLRDLIHLFKYARMRTLERPLGRFLATALPREERFDFIVPVPMHWRKRWSRGFNQAERLARAVSRRSGLPVWQGLRRTRKTSVQAGLTLAERRINMETCVSGQQGDRAYTSPRPSRASG